MEMKNRYGKQRVIERQVRSTQTQRTQQRPPPRYLKPPGSHRVFFFPPFGKRQLSLGLRRTQAYWRVTSKRVVDNACMLLETSFFGEVVDRLETQLLALTQEISEEEHARKPPTKEAMGWQQPRLGIFNVSGSAQPWCDGARKRAVRLPSPVISVCVIGRVHGDTGDHLGRITRLSLGYDK